MENVVVSAIYCDDIRAEMGGKHSYMGVYNTELVVGGFPVSLPKFCVHVTIRLPIGTNADALSIRLAKDDTTLVDIPFPEGELQNIRATTQEKFGSESIELGVMLVLQLAPLQLDNEGKITVRAILDGVEYKGNALRVREQNEQERAAMALPHAMPAQ